MKNHLACRLLTLITLIVCSFSLSACSKKNDEQAKVNVDADYFIGLKMLQEGNEKEAVQKFLRCKKNGSYYCAKKSAEALVYIGDIQEKNTAAQNLLDQFPGEEDSLIIAVKQFQSANEINKVLELTKGLDFSKAKNELIKIRLECLKKRGDASFEQEVYDWFTSCNISNFHYQFYRDTYQHPDFIALQREEEIEFTPEQFVIDYRIQLYKRDYTYAFAAATRLIEYLENGTIKPLGLIASDLGKAYLYGDMSFANNGAKFKTMAEKFAGTEAEFFFWFYAGRLYDKAGLYYKQTKNCFESAMKSARTPDQQDNTLWYLLNSTLKTSVDSAISLIETYSDNWHDPHYYEDFFEGLISPLLAGKHYNSFYKIYKALDGKLCDEIVGQYAYIYARLAQEKYTEGSVEQITEALNRACHAGDAVYYKVMAAYQLGLKGAELNAVLAAPYKYNEPVIDEAAQTLLEGYVTFGFPELIYQTWQELYTKGLPQETYFYLADFLIKCASAGNNHDYGTQGTRIAAKGVSNATHQLTKEQLRKVYPTLYSDYIEESCAKYNIDPSILYALIRSESFFDEDVISSAGAVGLTQLMESTAGDIARKLKMPDYDLTEAATNVEFGAFYLAELIRRCDNSILQSFFAYNAGITRVRRWVKSSNMPMDLFLETLPYAETREYGRKLISATSMYEYLASEDADAFNNIVEKLVK